MKTRKTTEIKCINDFDAMLQAQEMLIKAVQEQPYCKHTITVELSNGNMFQIYANPRIETVYYA